ncbi:MAG: cytochrome P450 [Sphingomonadales bacterium]
MSAIEDYSFFDPRVQKEPFELYRLLRAERPVWFSDELGCFVVSKHKLIKEVLEDTGTFSSIDANSGMIINDSVADKVKALRARGCPQVPYLATNDPPTHGPYRKLTAELFSRDRINGMQPDVERIVAMLLAPMLERGGGEFMSEFAEPLPLAVIANLLGVPLELVPEYKKWTNAYVEPLGRMLSPEREIECAELTLEYQRYFIAEIEKRRTDPRDDLLTQLINAEVPGEDRTMDIPELLAAVQQFLVAGGETTTYTIGNGLLLMIQNPALMEQLRADDKRIRNFIEEVLRTRSPSQGLYRIVKRDTEIGGVPIPKGSVVNVRIGAGNRDEAVFDHGERFDPDRKNLSKHLSFGVGLHFCMGAQLSRNEIFASYRHLLDETKAIRLDKGKGGYDYFQSTFFMGFSHFHVLFDR